MGSIKEQWLAEQEYKRDKILADILGITHVELDSTQWELKELKNNDGAVTYLLVKFDEASPKEILDKIERLDENNTVWLEPNELTNYQELDEEELGGEG